MTIPIYCIPTSYLVSHYIICLILIYTLYVIKNSIISTYFLEWFEFGAILKQAHNKGLKLKISF